MSLFFAMLYPPTVRVGRPAKRLKALRLPNCHGNTSKGRTNGMPWDGTSPCTVSTTVPDSRENPRPDEGLLAWKRAMGVK